MGEVPLYPRAAISQRTAPASNGVVARRGKRLRHIHVRVAYPVWCVGHCAKCMTPPMWPVASRVREAWPSCTTRSSVRLCWELQEPKEIGISLPHNQPQHRTLHVQKDMLPYALC